MLEITSIANGGSNSSIGASSNAASNLRFNSGFNDTSLTTLRYIGGADASTDRLFTLYGNITGTNSRIESSGAGTLSFTNTGAIASGHQKARNFYLGGTNTGDNTFAPSLSNFTEVTTFTKQGVGKWIITGTHTYTGATTIEGGKLTLGVTDCLANTSNVVIGAGTLDVGAGFTDTVGTLDCTGAATINLGQQCHSGFRRKQRRRRNWAGTLNITGTFVPGNGTDPGNPGSLRFGIDNTGLSATQLSKISATGWSSFGLDAFGYLTATPVGGGSAYDTWKTANAPGSHPDDDTDGDGVTNAVEFVLGGTSATNDLDKLPVVATNATDMTFTFKRKQSSIDPKTSVAIEVGTDLVTWTTRALTLHRARWCDRRSSCHGGERRSHRLRHHHPHGAEGSGLQEIRPPQGGDHTVIPLVRHSSSSTPIQWGLLMGGKRGFGLPMTKATTGTETPGAISASVKPWPTI